MNQETKHMKDKTDKKIEETNMQYPNCYACIDEKNNIYGRFLHLHNDHDSQPIKTDKKIKEIIEERRISGGTTYPSVRRYLIEVWEKEDVQGGTPCIDGTRIPLSSIFDFEGEIGLDKALSNDYYGGSIKDKVHFDTLENYTPNTEVQKKVISALEGFANSLRYKKGEKKEPNREGFPCHDCGAKDGEYHIDGCDAERCEFCGGQRISCYCNASERFENKLKQYIQSDEFKEKMK